MLNKAFLKTTLLQRTSFNTSCVNKFANPMMA